MSRIPQSFISDLVARTDLLDLIGARVTLKRAGSSHKGLCPFHDEKTPSFTVSPERGFYKCFGCGAYGNAIDFVMNYENLDFLEAVEILAELNHLEIPVERGSARPTDEFDELFAVMREADQFYRQRLRENPDAIAYLKRRGIDGETAGRFALGFAPDAWGELCAEFGGDDKATERLLRAGLAVKSDKGRVYDRFRHRVMFPIRDGRGRVIGFGGRLLEAGEPKYLNSPDTPLFDKSRTLYGLFEARQRPGRPERIVVVEGYVDVIALDQFGCGPALATMGTAATAENMRQLTRLADRVVFCFDGDRAGRDAAWRAVEAILPFGGGKVAIEFVLLPDGEDPDSFVRGQGKDTFEALLADATPLSTFMIRAAAAELDLGNADGRSRLLTTLKPLLERLAAGHYRELILAELADAVGIAPERLAALLADDSAGRDRAGGRHGSDAGLATGGGAAGAMPASGRRAPARTAGAAPANRSRMRAIMTFVLHYPGAVSLAGALPDLAEIEAPGTDLLRRLLEITLTEPKITTGQLLERFDDEQERTWIRQLAGAEPEPLESAADAPRFVRDSLEQLLEAWRKSQRGVAIRGHRPTPTGP